MEDNIKIPRTNPERKKFFTKLEKYFNVHNLADDCKNWSNKTEFYLYTYRDTSDIRNKLIYVGIGIDNRAEIHWKERSHSQDLNDWVKHWKNAGLKFEDVVSFVHSGITQREAAILETYYIEMHSPVCNLVRYWTPDGGERSDELRDRHTELFKGKKKAPEVVNKVREAKTNKLVLDLYYKDTFVKRFYSESSTSICEYIRNEYGHVIHPGNLWKALHGTWKSDSISNYKLKIASGELKGRSAKERIRFSYSGGKPCFLCTPEGKKWIVFSSGALEPSKKLGYDNERISQVLSGKIDHCSGFVARFLTDDEEEGLAKSSPLKRWISIDNGSPIYFISITRLLKKLFPKENLRGFSSNLGKVIRGKQSYTRQMKKNFSGGETWTLGDPDDTLKYLLVEYQPKSHSFIKDNLRTEYIGYTRDKDGDLGVQKDISSGMYRIRFHNGKTRIVIGQTKSLEIANEVADFFVKSGRKDKKGAQILLERLKKVHGEPQKKVAEKTSKVMGVNWQANFKGWSIRFSVNGRHETLGYTKDQEIAEKVASYFLKSEKADIDGAKELLKKLRLAIGEITKTVIPQSTVPGVMFTGSSWKIKYTIDGKTVRIGSTKNKGIAEEVAQFFLSSNKTNISEAISKLLYLKKENKEKDPPKAKYKSKVKGVYWNEKLKKWRLNFTVDGKYIAIGTTTSQKFGEEVAKSFLADKSKDVLKAKKHLSNLNQTLITPWRSFELARDWARKSSFQTMREWKKSKLLPTDIPKSPSTVYKNTGWTSWRDFLGTSEHKV